jgi:GTP-binding protein EngB required for normal cell division
VNTTSTTGQVTETKRYLDSVEQLEQALELGKRYLPIELLKQGRQVLIAARQRLELGVEHTIVALAGGTGSGKSSTFNALAGLEFADVGVKRPTTVRTAACTWDSDASALLDWIGVDNDRRISRDTVLDGDDQKALKGLILLDLPDHDSIAEHHRDIVNKVVPLVDVLIWIVDPQKYADHTLHADYLRKMVDARASMIVALNQVDTVKPAQRDELLWDVAKLLSEDGLDDVEVRPISAKTGEGIATLRDEIRIAVAGRSMASRRMGDELLRLARIVNDQVPGGVVTDLSASRRSEADRYLVAAGVPALADEVNERTARNASTGAPPSVQVPSETTLSGLRNRWLDRLTDPMRSQWAKRVRERTGSVEELSNSLRSALTQVEVPWGPVPGASVVPAVVSFALGFVCVVVGILGFAGVVGNTSFGQVLFGAAILCGLGGYALLRRRVARLRHAGRERAEQVREDAAEAVGKVIDGVLFVPVSEILETHDRISKIADHVIGLNIR